jgi:inward rectifier potassium channel
MAKLRDLFLKKNIGELGFGNTATSEGRLMGANGEFKVERRMPGKWQFSNTYYWMIHMNWFSFLGFIFLYFFIVNVFFASTYFITGVHFLQGIKEGTSLSQFLQCFFFSTQTFTTVGYGHISPSGLLTNFIASFESLMGLLSFALISGLLYGRFSKPTAKVIYSENLLLGKVRGENAFLFRLANATRHELIEAELQIIFSINQEKDGKLIRKFQNLEMEYNKINFFTLTWTAVHFANENSPLKDITLEELRIGNAEFLILFKAIDDIYSQQVHSRTSYHHSQIVSGKKFSPIVGRKENGIAIVDLSGVGKIEDI